MTEEQINREVLNNPTTGLIYYYDQNPDSVESTRTKLTSAFPDKIIFVTPYRSALFPADLGHQINNSYYTLSAGGQEITRALAASIKDPNELKINEALLPELHAGNNYHIEGGLLVPLPNTDRVIIAVPQQIEFRYESTFMLENKRPIFLPVQAIMKKLDSEDPNNIYHAQHIDLLLTAFPSGNQTIIWIEEKFFNMLGDQQKQPLKVLNPIYKKMPHELAENGALNIAYIDKKALVISRDVIGTELANDIETAGFEIIEMGHDHFKSFGGPKCRTMRIDWKTI